VPDLPAFAAANDLVGKSDAHIRATLGNKFPKHIYHTIVCIGALVAHRESDHWAVDALGAPHVGERTEKQLIASFCDKIAELKPQLVTFNGNQFDLPVLRYRAMVHGVSAPGLLARPYFNRYTDDAVDLCDVLSSFSPQGKATLHEISRIMGLPGKPKGFMAVRSSATSARARSRRSPTTARPTWSTPTRCGCATSCSAAR
jgi:3'-5' exonuclease